MFVGYDFSHLMFVVEEVEVVTSLNRPRLEGNHFVKKCPNLTICLVGKYQTGLNWYVAVVVVVVVGEVACTFLQLEFGSKVKMCLKKCKEVVAGDVDILLVAGLRHTVVAVDLNLRSKCQSLKSLIE